MNYREAAKNAVDYLEGVLGADEGEMHETMQLLREQTHTRPEHISTTTLPYEHMEDMAPSNGIWHMNYALGMQQIQAIMRWLEDTSKEPPNWDEDQYGAWDSGDLGDYCDALSNLLSFRPHTATAIEQAANQKLNEDGGMI
jgi:hypothetical protein